MDLEELNRRHTEVLDTYELGKLTLKEFLDRTCSTRNGRLLRLSFGNLCSPSRKPYPEMIDLVAGLRHNMD